MELTQTNAVYSNLAVSSPGAGTEWYPADEARWAREVVGTSLQGLGPLKIPL